MGMLIFIDAKVGSFFFSLVTRGTVLFSLKGGTRE